MNEVYINKKIQAWIDKLTDLFCLEDNKPTVFLRPNRNNMSGNCKYATIENNSVIVIGCRDGLRLTTLVHEFIHAMGYGHINNINGYSHFNHLHDNPKWRYNKTGFRKMTDTYSLLIVKDLTGKKELII